MTMSARQTDTPSRPSGSGPDSQERLFCFLASGREFAVDMTYVRRVVPRKPLVRPPDAVPGLLGLATHQAQTLPVFSLDGLSGLTGNGSSMGEEWRYILVLEYGAALLGLAIDAPREILADEAVGPASTQAENDAHGTEISGILRLDDGRRLVFILRPSRIFAATTGEAADSAPRAADSGPKHPEAGDPDEEAAGETADDRRHVCFELAGTLFAAPMTRVREVTRLGRITPVPQARAYYAGLINLRGEIMPALDLRRRLGLPEAPVTEETRVLVVGGQSRHGLIVDRIADPLDLDQTALEPLPEACRDESAKTFVHAAAKSSQGNPILLLDLDAVTRKGAA